MLNKSARNSVSQDSKQKWQREAYSHHEINPLVYPFCALLANCDSCFDSLSVCLVNSAPFSSSWNHRRSSSGPGVDFDKPAGPSASEIDKLKEINQDRARELN